VIKEPLGRVRRLIGSLVVIIFKMAAKSDGAIGLTVTRSKTDIWIIGQTQEELPGNV